MPKKAFVALDPLTGQPSKLISAYVDHPDTTIRKRVQAIELLDTGLDLTLLARLLNISPRVLKSWKERFDAHGIDGLADTARDQLPSKLPASYRKKFEILAQGDPMDYGYGSRDGWPLERLCDELGYETGLYLAPGALWLLMLDWGYKPGQHTLDRRSPTQKQFEAYFVRTLADPGLQRAAQETDAAHAKVTIVTWRPSRQRANRRLTELESQVVNARISQLSGESVVNPTTDTP